MTNSQDLLIAKCKLEIALARASVDSSQGETEESVDVLTKVQGVLGEEDGMLIREEYRVQPDGKLTLTQVTARRG